LVTDAQARVDQIAWYHEIDFGGGVRSRTTHENPAGVREVWRFIERQLARVPFADRSVLDIGAWDGYWSFLAERRGAREVLAADDASQRWAGKSGIHLARELLNSHIAIREDVPVYELSGLGRTFDVILCFGVYYHLWDPLRALVEIRRCCHRDTIVLVEGELAWSGMTQLETRYAQSPWQECVLAAPLLDHFLRLAYFRIDEQAWMHPVPPRLMAEGDLQIDRSMLVCRPFEGANPCYTYRPHFGLEVFDDRFRPDRGTAAHCAALAIVEYPSDVPCGAKFGATIRVTNCGDGAWRAFHIAQSRGPLLDGHSATFRNVDFDFARAFLDKQIVPGSYVNEGVARYRRYIEDNLLQGGVTAGVQLWDAAEAALIDFDYSRGFLRRDLGVGESETVTITMRAPATPGRYTLRFDMVCEYVRWFGAGQSPPLSVPLIVR
jgi:tRNA (mo5U34)-methyltransferase